MICLHFNIQHALSKLSAGQLASPSATNLDTGRPTILRDHQAKLEHTS